MILYQVHIASYSLQSVEAIHNWINTEWKLKDGFQEDSKVSFKFIGDWTVFWGNNHENYAPNIYDLYLDGIMTLKKMLHAEEESVIL